MKKSKLRKQIRKRGRKIARAKAQARVDYLYKTATAGPLFFPSVPAATASRSRQLPSQPLPPRRDPYTEARIAAEIKDQLTNPGGINASDSFQREHAAELAAAIDADYEVKARLARLL
jgi:hypothetical protein